MKIRSFISIGDIKKKVLCRVITTVTVICAETYGAPSV